MNLRRVRAADADPAEYLAGANAAFGHWGDEAFFAWAFRGDAELLFLDDVAGCGVTFRTLSSGETAAIVTGAWTLPAARRRGALTMLVETTRDIARERGGNAMAFMRADNPSARRLAALGARMHPSFYCRRPKRQREGRYSPIEPDPAMFSSTFVYTSDEWRKQYLERPHANIECVGQPGRWAAIVERTADYDRVHAISDERFLPSIGGRLFWFTLKRPSIACEWVDGFVCELPASSVSEWILQNADRM